jgi:SpoVK/Ycf46/Vps4 family AAA+-type ATPase
MPNERKISFATKIIPHHNSVELILPNDKKEQIREIINYFKLYDDTSKVKHLQKRSRKGGLNILFSGRLEASKNVAVEVIANELRLDVFRIDLAMIVTKYISETEKNLNKIFREAENCDAILFFDEADALFGKRSEIRDAHDHYENIEINYLLGKIEEIRGLNILSTNSRKNVAEAVLRRMNFILDF